MRNYALTSREESKKFVTGYHIKDNPNRSKNIIVSMANGQKHTIRHSKKEENNLKSRMVDQVTLGEENKPELLKKKTLSTGLSIILGALGFAILLVGFIILKSVTVTEFLIPLGITTVLELTAISQIINTKEIEMTLEDLEKSIYEQENEEALNKAVSESKSNMLGLAKETVKKIETSLSDEQEPFDINSIANYSLKDIKIIMENVSKNNAYAGKVKKLERRPKNGRQQII